MKKNLKIYLSISLLLFLMTVGIAGYLVAYHSVVVRFVTGSARLISSPVRSVIKIDGKVAANAKVFHLDDGKLLVYNPNAEQTHPVIIIDKLKNDIGTTNAGKEYYELIGDRYLFQADSAYGIVYASDAKWEYNPNLSITDTGISYTTQKLENNEFKDIPVEILF